MKTYIKQIAGLVIPIIVSFNAKCQFAGVIPANKYSAYSIPDSLKKDADAVVRENLMRFRIKDVNNATIEGHEIVTVMNQEGNRYLQFAKFSDKFRSLSEAEVKVYNAAGVKLNTYSKKEMQSVSYGEGLVEDGMATYFNVSAPSYPITVEFSYTEKLKGTIDYPDDYIQSPYTSVEHKSYTVEVPNDLGIRYKVVNGKISQQITPAGDATTYLWEVKNLVARKSEKNNGSSSRYFPKIVVAPNKFKLDNYEGDMSSWKNFGEWNARLIGSGNQLSEKGKAFIQNLVKNATSDTEKAKVIYKYLQQNMRYVSIQLGIGGWRPFSADFVQEKKYGDCKALSNYARAALDAVGIKSYYAVVNAGANEEPAMEDFPSNQFNHIILCIPAGRDTTWLECTSKSSEFGELGNFTENRKALLITENGGVLVSTPASKASSNLFSTKTTIQLSEDGSATVETSMRSTGEFKQEQVYYLNQRSDDEKRDYMMKSLGLKQPDVITISNGSPYEKPFVTDAKMTYERLPVFRAGSKMFLQPRLYPLMDNDVPDYENRTQDYYFPYPFQVKDTTAFKLPEGFGPESVPKEKNISFPFATYNCRYQWDVAKKELLIIASLEIIQHKVKPADYNQLMEFKKGVDMDMNEKIVVKKM